MSASDINWIEAEAAYERYCSGIDDVLSCYEASEPVTNWCDNCIGWQAVCELAAMQREKERSK